MVGSGTRLGRVDGLSQGCRDSALQSLWTTSLRGAGTRLFSHFGSESKVRGICLPFYN